LHISLNLRSYLGGADGRRCRAPHGSGRRLRLCSRVGPDFVGWRPTEALGLQCFDRVLPFGLGFAQRFVPSLYGSRSDAIARRESCRCTRRRPRAPHQQLAVLSNGRTPDGRRQIDVRPRLTLLERRFEDPGGVCRQRRGRWPSRRQRLDWQRCPRRHHRRRASVARRRHIDVDRELFGPDVGSGHLTLVAIVPGDFVAALEHFVDDARVPLVTPQRTNAITDVIRSRLIWRDARSCATVRARRQRAAPGRGRSRAHRRSTLREARGVEAVATGERHHTAVERVETDAAIH
ncbi:unnamed protein product, partial [Pelagomonas calceolata]